MFFLCTGMAVIKTKGGLREGEGAEGCHPYWEGQGAGLVGQPGGGGWAPQFS